MFRFVSKRLFPVALCASAMLSGAGTLAAEAAKEPSAPSSGPEVVLSGGLTFNAIAGSEKNKSFLHYKKGDNGSNPVTKEDRKNNVHFLIDGARVEFLIKDAMDFGSFYQWMMGVSLSADRNTKLYLITPRVYASFLSKHASLTLGSYPAANALLSQGGVNLLGGSGGYGSSLHKDFVGITTGCHVKTGLTGDSANSNKLTIQSARLHGVQLGVSYSPDTKQVGSASRQDVDNLSASDFVYNRHFVSGGLNYDGYVADNTKLAISVTGVTGKPYASQTMKNTTTPVKFYNTRGLASGFVLDFDRFAFGAQYAWMSKTNQFKDDFDVTPQKLDATNMDTWSYKADDAQGPRFFEGAFSLFIDDKTKFALGYYYSTRQTGFKDTDGNKTKATAHIINTSITYQVTTAVQTYLEFFYHRTKNPAAVYEANQYINRGGDISKWKVVEDQRAYSVVMGLAVRF